MSKPTSMKNGPESSDAELASPIGSHGQVCADDSAYGSSRMPAGRSTSSGIVDVGSAVDRRTELAADRTVLAAERTYAAWVRTGLASLASGVGARALLDGVVPRLLALAIGSLLIVFSGLCFIAAVWREMMPVAFAVDARRLPAWLLVAINGLRVAAAVAALAGIWLS